MEFVHLCKTASAKRFHRQPTPHANLCLNHPSVYGGLLRPPRFVEELILPCDSIPVVKALSRMLPQLFRPDPAMSGSNQGIIIGQDFILLTHRDIPPQQLPHPPTTPNTPQHRGLSRTPLDKCFPDIVPRYWGQGEETRRSRTQVQGGLFATPAEGCKVELYHTREHSGRCQLRSRSRWPGLNRIV